MGEHTCPRWHRDHYCGRGIVSYNLSGTQYVAEVGAPSVGRWYIPAVKRHIVDDPKIMRKKKLGLLTFELTADSLFFLVFTFIFLGFPTGWECSLEKKLLEFAMLHSDAPFVA